MVRRRKGDTGEGAVVKKRKKESAMRNEETELREMLQRLGRWRRVEEDGQTDIPIKSLY